MGILNLTPDSFSDGGKYDTLDKALQRCTEMIEEGADIIDIGAESSRPGYIPVPAEEQIDRLLPVLERIKKEFDIPVSVDTADAKVAEAVIETGCDLINDIKGLMGDSDMAEIIARGRAACVLMHNRETPGYTDFFKNVKGDLRESVKRAVLAGVEKDRIILDPGIGFAKNYEQNLEVLRRLKELQRLHHPILLGTSRKSVIGLTLNLPTDERIEGTIATTVVGVMSGVSFVRVHDIKENVRSIRMTEAIMGRTVRS